MSRGPSNRQFPEMPWLALLAMLCQLLAPAVYAPHRQALAHELQQALGHGHHGEGRPAGGPADCLVHMALQAASAGAAPAPPPALPVRVADFLPRTPAVAVPPAESRTWRPQASRAPPRSSEPVHA